MILIIHYKNFQNNNLIIQYTLKQQNCEFYVIRKNAALEMIAIFINN